MRLIALTAGAICSAFLLGCSEAPAPTAVASNNAAATSTQSQHSPTQLEARNDRICKKMYAVPCSELLHLLGPLNAEQLGEPRACVNQGVAKFESGQWVADNKYQDPKTGERYGDLCVAVSI
ncbi:hypothetical protein GCM10027191_09020 [Novilysobacter erysipheiresistens]